MASQSQCDPFVEAQSFYLADNDNRHSNMSDDSHLYHSDLVFHYPPRSFPSSTSPSTTCVPPAASQRPSAFLSHSSMSETSSSLSRDTRAEVASDESTSPGEDNEEAPDRLGPLLSPCRRGHRRNRSEIEMPATRPSMNPASNNANIRELATSIANEYDLDPEHKREFDRIAQMDQYTISLHQTARLMKVEESIRVAEIEGFRDAPWYKYTIPMLCKDIMMHPSLPSFRLCGNNIHSKIVNNCARHNIPADIINESTIKPQVKKYITSILNNWRFAAKRKIELAIQNDESPWVLAQKLAHQDYTLTTANVYRASLLRQGTKIHNWVVEGSLAGRVIMLQCLSTLPNSPVRLIMTGDFWADIELLYLYLRKRSKINATVSQQKEVLGYFFLGFYRTDINELNIPLPDGSADPELPANIHHVNSRVIQAHQVEIDSLMVDVIGDDSALERAAQAAERKSRGTSNVELPPVYYE